MKVQMLLFVGNWQEQVAPIHCQVGRLPVGFAFLTIHLVEELPNLNNLPSFFKLVSMNCWNLER